MCRVNVRHVARIYVGCHSVCFDHEQITAAITSFDSHLQQSFACFFFWHIDCLMISISRFDLSILKQSRECKCRTLLSTIEFTHLSLRRKLIFNFYFFFLFIKTPTKYDIWLILFNFPSDKNGDYTHSPYSSWHRMFSCFVNIHISAFCLFQMNFVSIEMISKWHRINHLDYGCLFDFFCVYEHRNVWVYLCVIEKECFKSSNLLSFFYLFVK